MTPDQLAAIEARAQAATEGPWESLRAGMLGTRVVRVDGEWDGLVPDEFITMVTPALRKFDDADFIAHARTDVPALLALVREQRAAIDRVEALAASWEARGEHDMEASKEIKDDYISMEIMGHGADMVENARHLRNALTDPSARKEPFGSITT